MDALVAERVMGSHVCTEAGGCGVNYGKRYSSDIAAAWEVAERIRQPGVRWLRVEMAPRGVGVGLFEIREGRDHGLAWAFAPTVPLAICRAALLTTLEEE